MASIKRWFRWRKTKLPANAPRPLREFVYLDEVSLRSLLSSQIGEVTEMRSEQSSNGTQLNVDSAVGFRAPGFSKADLGSRYQTSNSSSLQTSRKATVQSWFGELYQIEGLRLIDCVPNVNKAATKEELLAIRERSLVAQSTLLKRGELVEFKVRLSAEHVYHLSTMVSEFSAIVNESPAVFTDRNVLGNLSEALPVMKALQHMLAGLVPLRCEAIDHVVLEDDGCEYVVHKSCLPDGLESTPLYVVGLTEHLAYWKDLRRVLFSDGAFTILGRVARAGLHESWTPIKLGDVFRAVAPDWDNQLNAASLESFANFSRNKSSVDVNAISLGDALLLYKDYYLNHVSAELSSQQDVELAAEIARLTSRAGTASGQRSAFQIVHDVLRVHTEREIAPEQDSLLRDVARSKAGLALFPVLSGTPKPSEPVAKEGTETSKLRLLDLEIVAIYW